MTLASPRRRKMKLTSFRLRRRRRHTVLLLNLVQRLHRRDVRMFRNELLLLPVRFVRPAVRLLSGREKVDDVRRGDVRHGDRHLLRQRLMLGMRTRLRLRWIVDLHPGELLINLRSSSLSSAVRGRSTRIVEVLLSLAEHREDVNVLLPFPASVLTLSKYLLLLLRLHGLKLLVMIAAAADVVVVRRPSVVAFLYELLQQRVDTHAVFFAVEPEARYGRSLVSVEQEWRLRL